MTVKAITNFKKFVQGALWGILGVGTCVFAAAVTFTDFTAATTISAADMNAKLNALKTAVNRTPITVVTQGNVLAGQFNLLTVDCPASHYAISGGVDSGNVNGIYVTQSGPLFGGAAQTHIRDMATGQYGAPTGWIVSAFNNTAAAANLVVAAVCMPQ